MENICSSTRKDSETEPVRDTWEDLIGHDSSDPTWQGA